MAVKLFDEQLQTSQNEDDDDLGELKATGERYLPTAAIKALSSAEYSASSAAKRKASAAGKQVSKQPRKIAQKTKRFR